MRWSRPLGRSGSRVAARVCARMPERERGSFSARAWARDSLIHSALVNTLISNDVIVTLLLFFGCANRAKFFNLAKFDFSQISKK